MQNQVDTILAVLDRSIAPAADLVEEVLRNEKEGLPVHMAMRHAGHRDHISHPASAGRTRGG